MGLILFAECDSMELSTFAADLRNFNLACALSNEVLRETLIKKLELLAHSDQEKVLEYIEQLIESGSRKREFDNLQRPLVWAS
jgi:hypothetical protein